MDTASSGILFDSAVIAAIISAIIAIGFLIIREYIFEPKKWKKDVKKETLLKQIESHGRILSFLDDAEARQKTWKKVNKSNVNEKATHLFLLPGHEIQFNQIFRDNLAYLTNDIIESHKTFIESDTDFHFAEKKWVQDQSSWHYEVDLSNMHALIQNEFNKFREKYEEITDYSFKKS